MKFRASHVLIGLWLVAGIWLPFFSPITGACWVFGGISGWLAGYLVALSSRREPKPMEVVKLPGVLLEEKVDPSFPADSEHDEKIAEAVLILLEVSPESWAVSAKSLLHDGYRIYVPENEEFRVSVYARRSSAPYEVQIRPSRDLLGKITEASRSLGGRVRKICLEELSKEVSHEP